MTWQRVGQYRSLAQMWARQDAYRVDFVAPRQSRESAMHALRYAGANRSDLRRLRKAYDAAYLVARRNFQREVNAS